MHDACFKVAPQASKFLKADTRFQSDEICLHDKNSILKVTAKTSSCHSASTVCVRCTTILQFTQGLTYGQRLSDLFVLTVPHVVVNRQSANHWYESPLRINQYANNQSWACIAADHHTSSSQSIVSVNCGRLPCVALECDRHASRLILHVMHTLCLRPALQSTTICACTGGHVSRLTVNIKQASSGSKISFHVEATKKQIANLGSQFNESSSLLNQIEGHKDLFSACPAIARERAFTVSPARTKESAILASAETCKRGQKGQTIGTKILVIL